MTPQELSELLLDNPHGGWVEWIGIRRQRRMPLVSVPRIMALTNQGLEGDHRCRHPGSKRQVTFIQFEHMAVVASLAGVQRVSPGATRRNVVLSGVNVFALRNTRFRIGDSVFSGTGICHPCSRMENTIGRGGFSAMRGHGGITAVVEEGGRFAVNDAVEILELVSRIKS